MWKLSKFLIVLGGCGFVLVAAVIALVSYATYAGSKYDASSKAYVDRVLPEIIGAWSAHTLEQEAATKLKLEVPNEQIGSTFRRFSVLGRLVAYRGSHGESKVSFTLKNGEVVTAKYEADAEFEHGNAEIDVSLVRPDGRWQIVGFFVKSNRLLK